MTGYLNHSKAGVNLATMELQRPGWGQLVFAVRFPSQFHRLDLGNHRNL